MASTAPPNAPPQPQPQPQPAPGQLPPGAIRLAPGQRLPPGAQRIPMPPPGAPRPMMPPQTDPALLEALDATFEPQPIAFHAQEPYMVLCPEHKLEKCAACDVDYAQLNRLSRLLAKNPNLRCPPPPQVMSRELQAAVTGLKEEGNVSGGVHCTGEGIADVGLPCRNCSKLGSTNRRCLSTRWQRRSPSSDRHGRHRNSCART